MPNTFVWQFVWWLYISLYSVTGLIQPVSLVVTVYGCCLFSTNFPSQLGHLWGEMPRRDIVLVGLCSITVAGDRDSCLRRHLNQLLNLHAVICVEEKCRMILSFELI